MPCDVAMEALLGGRPLGRFGCSSFSSSSFSSSSLRSSADGAAQAFRGRPLQLAGEFCVCLFARRFAPSWATSVLMASVAGAGATDCCMTLLAACLADRGCDDDGAKDDGGGCSGVGGGGKGNFNSFRGRGCATAASASASICW